jgi:hypothetical protein
MGPARARIWKDPRQRGRNGTAMSIASWIAIFFAGIFVPVVLGARANRQRKGESK